MSACATSRSLELHRVTLNTHLIVEACIEVLCLANHYVM